MQYNKYMDKVGTLNNPITLDQSQEDNTDLLETARNKGIIQQALITKQPLDICLAVVKTKIDGDLPTKQRQLNKAIIAHFKQEININISCGYFHPKLQADYSDPQTKVNPCQLLLYGVDFLTTSLIKDRFTILQTEVREIVWINDSLCKLIYGSPQEAQRVISDQAKHIKMQQQSDDLPHEWFSIKSYTIFSFERLLWIRYATTEQSTLQKEKKGLYDQFALAKRKLGQHLLQQFDAIQSYKNILNLLDSQSMMDRRHNRHSQRYHNRSRDKNRNHQRFRREFEDDHQDNRFKKKKYQPQTRRIQEIHVTHYAHRPVNMEESFYSRHNQQYNQNRNRNNGREYLDFDRQNKQNMNLSFRFNNQHQRNANKNNSFEYNPVSKKKCYDVGELDSQLSFNHFGGQNVDKNNERDDFHCDYHFDKDLNKLNRGKNDVATSFLYEPQKTHVRKEDINNSFAINHSYRKSHANNNSFNFGNANKNKSEADLSYIANQANKSRVEEADFFDLLNSMSPVRAVQQEQNTSFKFDKNKKKKNDDRILSDSFYQQDSY